MFAPADSMMSYCSWGCVLGLGYVPEQPGGGWWGTLSAIGLGYAGELSAQTIIHEVGHNHGRLHAPCEVSDPDPNYPYPNGSIGVWGAFPTFERSLKSLGITSDGVGTTKLSDAFDPSRPLNDLIAQSMRQVIEQSYRRFIQRVAEGRNMQPEAVEKIARGRVWAGTTAKELGLEIEGFVAISIDGKIAKHTTNDTNPQCSNSVN